MGADLSKADLREAKLDQFRDDFWAVLSAEPREVCGLRLALLAHYTWVHETYTFPYSFFKLNNGFFKGDKMIKSVEGLQTKVVDAECLTFASVDRCKEPAFYSEFEDHTPAQTNHEPRVSIYKGASLDTAINEINELRKENAELKEKLKQFEWRPIETASEGKEVLVCTGDQRLVASKDIDKWWDASGNNLCEDENNFPTHWMPLPPPPEDK